MPRRCWSGSISSRRDRGGDSVRTVSDDNKPNPASPSDAEETVEAIHHGNVDALVVRGPDGLRVLMLEGADQPYRMLVERMSEGALTLGPDNSILYANQRLSELLGRSPEDLVGKQFDSLFVETSPSVQDRSTGEGTLLGAAGA